jgi:hypothetical protein
MDLKSSATASAFERECLTLPRGSFVELRGSATLEGVGFFDFFHHQRGFAKSNGIELHPVLNFQSSSCERR